MASIANELDLNGFEKEANQVTEAMARMAQPNLMKQRMEPGQYKISQPALKEIQDFVATHQLDVPDAYAWVLGKFGRGQANEWRASIEGNVAAQAPSAAAQPNPSAVANPTNAGGSGGNLVLDPIAPLTKSASSTKKKVFAQPVAQNSLASIIQSAQAVQNAILAKPLADFNNAKEISKDGSHLGELALSYFNFASAVRDCANKINDYIKGNLNAMANMPIASKTQVVTNIFAPILKITKEAKAFADPMFAKNLGGLFAGSAGANVKNADAEFNQANKIASDLINSFITPTTTAPPAAPAPSASPQQAQV